MAKSYFSILGIGREASPEEIKSAYQRLVKEYHPDHYLGDGSAFRNIQEAYSVLGNSRKRNRYEQTVAVTRSQRPSAGSQEPLIPSEGPAPLGEVSLTRSFQTYSPSADEIFDWLWNNFAGMHWPKSARVQALTLNIPLTREQARRGGNAEIMVPARARCPSCKGRGLTDFYECPRCAGEGAISGEVPVALSFPPGLTRDHAVVVPLDRFGIRNLHVTVLFRLTDG